MLPVHINKSDTYLCSHQLCSISNDSIFKYFTEFHCNEFHVCGTVFFFTFVYFARDFVLFLSLSLSSDPILSRCNSTANDAIR